MKNNLVIFSVLLFYIIISPGFQCGGRGPDFCDQYTYDSIPLTFEVYNNDHSFHELDTISMSSVICDTFHTNNGENLVIPCNNLYASIQPYKVVNIASGPQLNYANIEFNPIVSEGFFQNNPYQSSGYNFLYNRLEPYNRLKPSLIVGSPGLYLIKVGVGNTSYTYSDFSNTFFDSKNPCNHYLGSCSISAASQQKQFWDSLGTTILRLANSNEQIVSSKEDHNYFFVKVDR